jgi:hypothetical protein
MSEYKNIQQEKYNMVVELKQQLKIGDTIDLGSRCLMYNTFKNFKGVKQVEIECRLTHNGHMFIVETKLTSLYFIKPLYEIFTHHRGRAENIFTEDTIFQTAKIMMKHMETIKELEVDDLFSIYPTSLRTKQYLLEDIKDAELEENDTCCICYKNTKTKLKCCKGSVCKVCLIEMGVLKMPIEIDGSEEMFKNKLVCPLCRKDHNDFREDELTWKCVGDFEDEDE